MSTTPYKGFGLTPFGTTPFGYGTPSLASPNVGKIFDKNDGSIGDNRLIDPRTRDYLINPDTGRIYGQSAIQQLVYLALVTVKGSSAVTSLGQDFTSIQLKVQNIEMIIKNEVALALNRLITKKLIRLLDVTVEFVNGAALIHVLWVDTSQDIQVETIV